MIGRNSVEKIEGIQYCVDIVRINVYNYSHKNMESAKQSKGCGAKLKGPVKWQPVAEKLRASRSAIYRHNSVLF